MNVDSEDNIITKELLSKITGMYVYHMSYSGALSYKDTIRIWETNNQLRMPDVKNIYSLANEAKQYAFKEGYNVITYMLDSGVWWDCYVTLKGESNLCEPLMAFYHKINEPAAVFSACQWIMDQKMTDFEWFKSNRDKNPELFDEWWELCVSYGLTNEVVEWTKIFSEHEDFYTAFDRAMIEWDL